jgi:nickel-dependent lactate racemase
MIMHEQGSPASSVSAREIKDALANAFAKSGNPKRLLIVPPDITRLHSRAGEITRMLHERDPSIVKAIIPALGTHTAMTSDELRHMFGDIPQKLFRVHHWRSDCVRIGEVPGDFVATVSGGVVSYPIPVSVNRCILDGQFDGIVSLSQVVPHEVAGMAGFAKNLLVGLGGQETIHKTHFLGAAYGIEKTLGRADSPVQKAFRYAVEHFFPSIPVIHILTAVARDPSSGDLVTRGLFIGSGYECYLKAAALAKETNITLVDRPITKAVVYLDPGEYRSTWLGNKSIYRLRMAIADKGELVVMAPGVNKFGEDAGIDRLVRRVGYRGTPTVMAALDSMDDLRDNLSAAAHLIHGSTEGRFRVTYCAGGLTKAEIEHAGFAWAPVEAMVRRYDPGKLKDGWCIMPDGEEIFYVSNPGIGLWAERGRMGK